MTTIVAAIVRTVHWMHRRHVLFCLAMVEVLVLATWAGL